MDPIEQSTKNKNRNASELVTATLALMLDKRIILLIPFLMYNGLEQAYIQGDFTRVKHIPYKSGFYKVLSHT